MQTRTSIILNINSLDLPHPRPLDPETKHFFEYQPLERAKKFFVMQWVKCISMAKLLIFQRPDTFGRTRIRKNHSGSGELRIRHEFELKVY
jgi:hypothetical protein